MNNEERTHHIAMKKVDHNYPSLPKFMGSKLTKHKKLKRNKGYVDSVIRGFRTRVYNWKKANDYSKQEPIVIVPANNDVISPLEALREKFSQPVATVAI